MVQSTSRASSTKSSGDVSMPCRPNAMARMNANRRYLPWVPEARLDRRLYSVLRVSWAKTAPNESLTLLRPTHTRS